MSLEHTPQNETKNTMITVPEAWTRELNSGSVAPEAGSDGEYHGGSLEAIARRSGVPVEEIQAAALASIERQKTPEVQETAVEAVKDLGGQALDAAQRVIEETPVSVEAAAVRPKTVPRDELEMNKYMSNLKASGDYSRAKAEAQDNQQ